MSSHPIKSKILVGFGANVGDSRAAYGHVCEALEPHGIDLIEASDPIQTEPIGGEAGEAQDAYLNAALLAETGLKPEQTIESLMNIERELGRVRDRRWGPRTVDLDLLLFGEQQIQIPNLTCPHPRMSFRRFVLEPASQVAGGMVHPPSGCTIAKLLDQLDSREPLVLWVGELPGKIKQLDGSKTPLGYQINLASAEVGSLEFVTSNSVCVHSVESAKALQELEPRAKLVLICDSTEDRDLLDRASNFAGATLRLDERSMDSRRELFSAIDAMM
jgi:2-amino-4-hydroxy-6-hydroxymethyldihydropteridine diphosphokinase